MLLEELRDWAIEKPKLVDSVNFLNSLLTVDKSLGDDNQTVSITVGNCSIVMKNNSIELTHGKYQNTKIHIEKNRIYFAYQDGTQVDLSDLATLADMMFREQGDGSGDEFELNVSLPLQFDADTSTLTINQAESSQDGFLTASNWNTFNDKQDGSTELTALAGLTTTGSVFRTGANSYEARGITKDDVSGLGTMATQNNTNISVTGGAIDNINITNFSMDSGGISHAGIVDSGVNSSIIGETSPSNAFFTFAEISAPDQSTVPLTLNVLNSGANTVEIRRENGSLGMRFLNSGSMEIYPGSFYRHSGFAVVGSRKTGWSNPAGTATRTAFTTSTVSVAQLAERVKALIDDLMSHGLIGT